MHIKSVFAKKKLTKYQYIFLVALGFFLHYTMGLHVIAVVNARNFYLMKIATENNI